MHVTFTESTAILGVQSDIMGINDIVYRGSFCYIVITSESILMSKYIAESNKQLILRCDNGIKSKEKHVPIDVPEFINELRVTGK